MTDKPLPDLMSFAHAVHSQHGEDGVIAEIFRRLGVERGVFCEFGAIDGVRNSNCRALFEKGWRGVFIEPSEEGFQKLRKNYAGHTDRITVLNLFVKSGGENSLDRIFARCGVDGLDFLSIDIDSDDLAVWRSLTAPRPKVVMIEYNYAIPFDIRYENPPGSAHGNGALSILDHAVDAGYDFVGFVGYNLIFCDRGVRPVSLPVVSLRRFIDEGARRVFFVGYDGTILRRDDAGRVHDDELVSMPHMPGYLLQPFPRWLRYFGGSPRRTRFRRRWTVLQAFMVRPFAVLSTAPRLWSKILGHRARRLARRERARNGD